MKKMLMLLFFLNSLTLGYAADSQQDWEGTAYQLTKQKPLPDRGKDRLMAYLFHAQKEFAANPDTASRFVIQLFYPEFQKNIFPKDPKVIESLNASLGQRFKQEERGLHNLALPENEANWKGKWPYHGLNIPTWKPWVLKSPNEFRLQKPPADEAFWQEQLAEVKNQMNLATDAEKKRILFWAEMLSNSASGDWLAILDEYMEAAHVPQEKQIAVRAAVSKAIADATIAAFDSKYTYLIKRPYMIDPSLKPYIETPNHPSFPSAHSTVSAAIVEVLNHDFPENQSEWNRLLEEAGMSRIWAGIHFPIDHQGGKLLGKKVGQAVLEPGNAPDFTTKSRN